MSVFRTEKVWRWVTNLWTAAFMLFIIWDFAVQGRYDFLIVPLSVYPVSINSE